MARPLTESLPDQTQPRIQALVERSAPNPDRPRLSETTEKKFEPVDRKTAACYASMEDMTDQLRRLAKQLEDKTNAINGR